MEHFSYKDVYDVHDYVIAPVYCVGANSCIFMDLMGLLIHKNY